VNDAHYYIVNVLANFSLKGYWIFIIIFGAVGLLIAIIAMFVVCCTKYDRKNAFEKRRKQKARKDKKDAQLDEKEKKKIEKKANKEKGKESKGDKAGKKKLTPKADNEDNESGSLEEPLVRKKFEVESKSRGEPQHKDDKFNIKKKASPNKSKKSKRVDSDSDDD